MRRRRVVISASLVLVAILLAAGGYMAAVLPRPQGPRVEVAPGVVGVYDGFAYSYLVRRGDAVVLVDAGNDPKARAILAELGREGLDGHAVQAILLTHGHYDHWRGAEAFPGAPVYVAAADHPLVRRLVLPVAKLTQLSTRLVRPKPYAGTVHEVLPGQNLSLAGSDFVVVPLPGHTAGSVGYLWQDVLFVGDAVFGTRAGVRPPPWFISDDASESRRSLGRLATLPFTVLADGHVGVTHDAHARITAWLSTHPSARAP